MNHITFADILSVIYIYISVRWSIYIIIIIIIMFESSILYTHESANTQNVSKGYESV